jgi:uncharacterized protein (TIGR00730 family)
MAQHSTPSLLDGAQPSHTRNGIGSGPLPVGDLSSLCEHAKGEEWGELEVLLHHARFPPGEYARVVRIMREFVEGHHLLGSLPPSVVIWGSARAEPGEPAYRAATETARLLATTGFGIITGGGPGIMEAGNKGAREAGAVSVGLPMESLVGEPPNAFLDFQHVFRFFYARKAMFVRYAEALVVFPGGYGTLDELFEALLLVQTGKVPRFPIILYGSTFWAGLVGWIRDTLAGEAKTIGPGDPDLLTISDDPAEICEKVCRAYQAVTPGQRAPSLYR